MKDWNLHDLVSHETGDSWNGTHGRIISLTLRGGDWIRVESVNAMSHSESVSAVFSRDDIRVQASMAVSAKYFPVFANELKCMAPDFYSSLPVFESLRVACDAEEDRKDTSAGRHFFFKQAIACSDAAPGREFRFKTDPADPLFQDVNDWQRSYLHMAFLYSFKDCSDRLVAAFLKAGTPPDLKDAGGVAPLHLAAHLGDVAAARHLIAAGADVGAQTMNGVTPLELAIVGHSSAMVSLLLSARELPERETFAMSALARRCHQWVENNCSPDIKKRAMAKEVFDIMRDAEQRHFQSRLAKLERNVPRRAFNR